MIWCLIIFEELIIYILLKALTLKKCEWLSDLIGWLQYYDYVMFILFNTRPNELQRKHAFVQII